MIDFETNANAIAIAKRAEKRRAVVAKSKSDAGIVKGIEHEPDLEPMNYKESLVCALNYYNSAYGNKEKREWTEDFVGHTFPNVPDYEFRTIGTLVRLFTRDQPLEETDAIDDEITRLNKLNITMAPVVVDKVRVASKEKNLDVARIHGAAFDAMLQETRKTGKAPDFLGYLNTEKPSVAAVSLIPGFYSWTIAELKEVFRGTDEQLTEAYAHIPRILLRKYMNAMESIAVACNAYSNAVPVIVKAIRKPRVIKPKAPSKIVASVKYMVDSPLLGKSINPVKLVGCTEAWIFNTKYRKLAIYRATDGNTLTVKGTTIIGFDETLSVAKAIRKPEYVKDLVSMGKRLFASSFKLIKAKESIPTGRINADCLIVKVV